MNLVEIQKAVVAVSISEGKELDLVGTAFFIHEEGYLFTCKHVIYGDARPNQDMRNNTVIIHFNKRLYEAEIVHESPFLDFIVLKVKDSTKNKFPIVELSEEPPVGLYNELRFVGLKPEASRIDVLDGKLLTSRILIDDTAYIKVNANPIEVYEGMSGGCAWHIRMASVIGIIARKSEEQPKEGLLIPMSLVLDEFRSVLKIGEEKPIIRPNIYDNLNLNEIWLKTNKRGMKISLSSLNQDKIVYHTPIVINGRIKGLKSKRNYSIKGFVRTDKEYPNGGTYIDENGFWKISRINLEAASHKVFFRIFENENSLIAESEEITIMRFSRVNEDYTCVINSVLDTNNNKTIKIGLNSPVNKDEFTSKKIPATGQLIGAPKNRNYFAIAYIYTDEEYEQSGALVNKNGFWKIDLIHLGGHKHELYFKVYDQNLNFITKSDSIFIYKKY